MKEKRLRVLEWAVGAATAASVGALAYKAYELYSRGLSSGEQMYTYETIGAAVSGVSWILWLFFALALATAILRFLYPGKRRFSAPDASVRAYYARRRLDIGSGSITVKRTAVVLLCGAAMLINAYIAGRKEFSPGYFASNDLEAEMAGYLSEIIRFCLWTVVLSCLGAILLRKYDSQIVEASKGCPGREAYTSKRGLLAARAAIFAAAAAFIIAGISNGGMYDVFVKAINICTECIGLG